MPAPAPAKHTRAETHTPRRGLTKLPWPEWFPTNWDEYRALKRNFGGVTGDLYLILCKNMPGDYKRGRPLECYMTDAYLADQIGCTEDGVRKAKRNLEGVKILIREKGPNQPYRVGWDEAREFAKLPLPPPRKLGKPECRPRTEAEAEPEAVEVQTPGAVIVIAITCPVHASGHTAEYRSFSKCGDTEGVTETHQYSSIGKQSSNAANPPPAEPPPPEPVATETEVLAVVNPECISGWGMVPTGPLVGDVVRAINATPNPHGTLSKLAARIARLAKAKKPMAIIKRLPTDASADYLASPAARPQPSEEPVMSEEELAEKERQSIAAYESKARKAWTAAKTPSERAKVKIRFPDVDFGGPEEPKP